MNQEIWEQLVVDGKEINYEISNIGNVRNQMNGKLLALNKRDNDDQKNYVYCTIYLDKYIKRTCLVHRLVALTFLKSDEDDTKIFVNHKNGNKHDNRVENLEWVSHSENVKHAHQNEDRVSTGKSIEQYEYGTDKFIQTFDSKRNAAKALEISEKNFDANLTGRTKCVNTPSGKFYFKRVEERLVPTEDDLKDFEPIKDHISFLIHRDGRIYNTKRKIFMKPRLEKGYYNLILNDKNYYIHRLIAIQFIPNPEKKTCVNHKDGNKENYHVDNLEWVTSSENNQHAYNNNLISNCQSVHIYNLNGKYIKTFKSIADACRELNLNDNCNSTITKCCQGQTKYSYNYIWRYASTHNTNDIESVNLAKNTITSIDKFDINDIYIATYPNMAEAAKSVGKTNKDTKLISNCCKEISKLAYGYKWKYS